MVIFLVGCNAPAPAGPSDAAVAEDSAAPRDSGPADTAPADTSILPDPDTAEPDRDYLPGTPDVVVDCAGGGDFATISEAVRASLSGTRIGLAPCAYRENLNYLGKSLDIFGLDGAGLTSIQGDGASPVVHARRGEGPGTRLAGVTVTGGGGSVASAFYLVGSVVHLDHVVVSGNHDAPAVLSAEGVGLTLTDVTFAGNTVADDGGVLFADNGNLLLERVTVDCGEAEYGLYDHSVALVRDSEFRCPDADAAIEVEGGELQVRRSRLEGKKYGVYAEDKADTPNERLWVYNSALIGEDAALAVYQMSLRAEHVVFWSEATALLVSDCDPESFVYSSAILGGTCPLAGAVLSAWNAFGEGGTCSIDTLGEVTGDPGFADAPEDFRLRRNSPLVDAGNPDGDDEDLDGTRSDIGMYGGPEP